MADTLGTVQIRLWTVSCHPHHLACAFLEFVSLSCIKYKKTLRISDCPLPTTGDKVTTVQFWEHTGADALTKNRRAAAWLAADSTSHAGGYSSWLSPSKIKLNEFGPLTNSPKLQHLQRWAFSLFLFLKPTSPWSRQAQCMENASFLPQFSFSSLQSSSGDAGDVLAATLPSPAQEALGGEEQYLSDLIYYVVSFNKLPCGKLLRISALNWVKFSHRMLWEGHK